MKIIAALLAGLIAACVIPAAAPAQMHHDRVVKRTVVRTDRHVGGGYRNHSRRVCKMERRGNHRARVCRTVRY